MDAKVKLLQTNDDWRERYEDLVKTGLISDTLFWSDKKTSIDSYQAYIQMVESSSKGKEMSAQQRAAAVLRRIRGVTDGKGEVKFRLTAEIIAAIYANLPRVKELHDEFVGSSMLTEKDFWTQFCTSKTFGKELGVGEEFTGKGGNIFDRAFASAPKQSPKKSDALSPAEEPARKEAALSEETELVERVSYAKKSLQAIKTINKGSLQSVQHTQLTRPTLNDMIDIADLHSHDQMDMVLDHAPKAPARPPTPRDAPAERIYDPDEFANVKLLHFSEYKEKVLGHEPENRPFATISESDFTEDHFSLCKRLYMNVIHLLRIFWRLQPMNTPEKQANCAHLLAVVDGIVADFSGLLWPDVEKAKAASLMHLAQQCVDTAHTKLLAIKR